MRQVRRSCTALCLLAAGLLVGHRSALGQGHMETGFLNRTITFGGLSYHYQVYVPVAYDPSRRWPVILFLHGAGERGRDGLLQTQVGLGAAIRQHPARYPAIVVFPQAPPDSLWTGIPAQVAMAALDSTVLEFQADQERVYLTGLSMGGNGAWYLAYRNPARFAALVPICGWVTPFHPWVRGFEAVVQGNGGSPFEMLARKLGHLPVWIYHGEEDNAVPVDQSRQAASALQGIDPNMRYTELPGVGHNSWDAAYGSTTFTTWLFMQRRKR